jgi:hypothetical protein
MAQMMGVRRTSVTTVAMELQSAGLISNNRGHLQILDIAQLRKRACECEEVVRSNSDELRGTSSFEKYP